MAQPATIRLRLKYNGTLHELQLLPSASWKDLQASIKNKTGVSESMQSILIGFPPKEIRSSSSFSTLLSLKIGTGTNIILQEKGSNHTVLQGKKWEFPPCIAKNKGLFARISMPGDNSCLFHTIAYVCLNKRAGKEVAAEMREIGAKAVASDPRTYNAVMLGCSPDSYVTRLRNPSVWGGAIELAVFARLYEMELVTFEYHNLLEEVFGEGQGYKRRAFVLYTGEHYDALAFQLGGTEEQVVFSPQDTNAWERARQQVFSLHQDAAKKGECKLQEKWRRNINKEKEKKTTTRDFGSGKLGTDNGWKCNQCTMQNDVKDSRCAACSAVRPSSSSSSGHSISTSPSYSSSSYSSSTLSSVSTSSSTTTSRVTQSSLISSPSTSIRHSTSSLTSGSSSRSSSLPSSSTTTTSSSASSISTGSKITSPSSSTTWGCTACTYVNPLSAKTCLVCNSSRPTPSSPTTVARKPSLSRVSSSTSREGSWTCEKCTYQNRYWTRSCNVCSAQNPGFPQSDD
eukprot:TRINITY_DN9127_c0_g1_i1.p1 TRINITY_DN9127_c0_g1~~TRINITY_DN9127_c0_g1_i1.p1  ORF type:complete len:512 (+),score=90.27 TRINITY_DN9127_c0_g1_i1:85-1620(+)